jgi:hypothetical protein
LLFVRLLKDASELFADFSEGLVPFDMVKFDAFPDLTVASWTKVNWTSIRLLKMVDTHHQALVHIAMTKAKHVAELMSSKLHNSH